MKTLEIIAILSMTMTLIGIRSSYAGNGTPQVLSGKVATVRYQVNVHLPQEISLCSPYVIEVVTDKGNIVGPAQLYREEISTYFFFEPGPARGIRMARLSAVKYRNMFVCPNALYCLPDIKAGNFAAGETYEFDLYPTTQRSRE